MKRSVAAWLLVGLSLGVPQFVKGDICDPNPCENGGICLPGLDDGSFSCECPDGFTDPNCSSVVEVASEEEKPTSAGPCIPNPCHNGGTCEISEAYRGDTFIGYVCKCPRGFNGIHCQHNINECEVEPCKNGGICTDLVANYSCECPGEFMGRNCQYRTALASIFVSRNLKMVAQSTLKVVLKSTSKLSVSEHLNIMMNKKTDNAQANCVKLKVELIIKPSKSTASVDHRASFLWTPGENVSSLLGSSLNKKGAYKTAWTKAAKKNDSVGPWIQNCISACKSIESLVATRSQVPSGEKFREAEFQINLQRKMRVTGVITQGAKRIGSPEYIKSYKIAYSNDGKTWAMYKVKGTNEDMVFRGNIDNNTPYANSFTPPIKAQYVRLYPQVCRRHCTLRMELLGCELSGCSEPLGMKSGHIQDYQITASSIFRTLNMDMFTWEPRKARLDKQGKVNAWTSGHNDQSQWLQVDLLVPTKVTGIITQGAKDFGHVQFVGSYKLAYSNDGEHWSVYQDEKQRKDKVFQGNFDNDTHRKNVIDPPIYARHIRILPWSWYGRITLRSELLGCTEEE
nr:EGF-like repeat and discoidin I-like domain-containing protein 3 [Aotus nancymaae]